MTLEEFIDRLHKAGWLACGDAQHTNIEQLFKQVSADTKRLDWLDQQGLCGIDHIGYGDYRYYFGGNVFGDVRSVIDKVVNNEHVY